MRDNGSCPDGGSCQYSHDPRVIAKARADKAKGKGGTKGGGKGKRSGGKAAGGNRVCQFYLSAAGCKRIVPSARSSMKAHRPLQRRPLRRRPRRLLRNPSLDWAGQ